MPRREDVPTKKWDGIARVYYDDIDHYHEWRQRWVVTMTGGREAPANFGPTPDGYYCIHCLEVREGSDG